jgi:hypothetical protein
MLLCPDNLGLDELTVAIIPPVVTSTENPGLATCSVFQECNTCDY